MTWLVHPLPTQEHARLADPEEAGFGTLTTTRGNLPLDDLAVHASITGLLAGVEVTQGFRNTFDQPLEASYVFPLPDRAAVTGMRMEADGHTVVAQLRERARARADYNTAIAEGRRASITEEERPDVFTMRVGNILPGERVVVRLCLVQPLPYADGAAEFRFPLVVAPRYVPGAPLSGAPVGTGWAPDTDAVPDASRITPPVLLPGLPNPVPLSIVVDVNPAGLPLGEVRSSLHAVVEEPRPGEEGRRIRIEAGERADRDFVLRLRYAAEQTATTAVVGEDGTFRVTVLPPADLGPDRPRDVVLLLDRSGSMAGWKMVAARRAAARIVDTLGDHDRFAVLGFDNRVETPSQLPAGLIPATDRNRYRAVEHLTRLEARGGTELLQPLLTAIDLLRGGRKPGTGLSTGSPAREAVLVLVTDGQVGNENQILREVTTGLAAVRVHVVGIDEAVNAGFLARLAMVGGGRCELVESEGRLDEAAEQIHRRIAAPVLTGVEFGVPGADPQTLSPRRIPPLFAGVPLVVAGRLAEGPAASPGDGSPGLVTVQGAHPDGRPWTASVPFSRVGGPAAEALTAAWARAHLRDLEDAQAVEPFGPTELEERIIRTSLRHGVLCRFTAFVAVDERVVTEGSTPHRVTQPVEPARGWDMLAQGSPDLPVAAPARTMTLSAFPPAVPAGPAPVGPTTPTVAEAALAPPTAAAPSPGPAPGLAQGPQGVARRFSAAAGTASGLRLQRTATGAGPSRPGPAGGPYHDEALPLPVDVRRRLELELRRLAAAAALPEPERIRLLGDLGTRLRVLVAELQADGGAPLLVAQLKGLLPELRACDEGTGPHGATFERIWQATVRTLEEMTRDLPGEHGQGPDRHHPERHHPGADRSRPSEAPDRSQDFWRRT